MLSETVQRFILTGIDSIPHLEAILLIRRDPLKGWNVKMVAQALFISEKNAEKILSDLCTRQIIFHQQALYIYDPAPLGLKEIINELAVAYSTNLIEITNLIHSKTSKQAQQFGDAFKWREE